MDLIDRYPELVMATRFCVTAKIANQQLDLLASCPFIIPERVLIMLSRSLRCLCIALVYGRESENWNLRGEIPRTSVLPLIRSSYWQRWHGPTLIMVVQS